MWKGYVKLILFALACITGGVLYAKMIDSLSNTQLIVITLVFFLICWINEKNDKDKEDEE